jgi:hypothetical protein
MDDVAVECDGCHLELALLYECTRAQVANERHWCENCAPEDAAVYDPRADARAIQEDTR